ncbi:uncharacterized protein Bfra_008350 [Botrytis fragariae]|uniref:Uncharacterized protein n=1 Tax=Botrytis fragariae TaxID=1964551 RepID=A0A8H6AT25_9HELO|nr:uncharacterized protein Bfra_008350 [Botrytis fragariae]KAF5873073.1 hypothetical protein Bfra_008350 [Botrytis fragariae]
MSLTAVPNDPRKFPKTKMIDSVHLQALRIFPKEKIVNAMSSLTRLLLKKKQERVATYQARSESTEVVSHMDRAQVDLQ